MNMNDVRSAEPFWGQWYLEPNTKERNHTYSIYKDDCGVREYAQLLGFSVPVHRREERNEEDACTDTYYREIASELYREIKIAEKLDGQSYLLAYQDHMIFKQRNRSGYDFYIRVPKKELLLDYFSRKTVRFQDIIHLGIEMCLALKTCEKYHLVHGGITPDCIYAGDDNHFYLCGFAMSKYLMMYGASEEKGRELFLAPELYKGKPADTRTDIYSLGLIMYYLLNQNHLYDVRSEREPYRPLPTPRNAMPELSTVILKACAVNPEERYQNAEEFFNALMAVSVYIAEQITYPVDEYLMLCSSKQVHEQKNSVEIEEETEPDCPKPQQAPPSTPKPQEAPSMPSPEESPEITAPQRPEQIPQTTEPGTVNTPVECPGIKTEPGIEVPVEMPTEISAMKSPRTYKRPLIAAVAAACILAGVLIFGFATDFYYYRSKQPRSPEDVSDHSEFVSGDNSVDIMQVTLAPEESVDAITKPDSNKVSSSNENVNGEDTNEEDANGEDTNGEASTTEPDEEVSKESDSVNETGNVNEKENQCVPVFAVNQDMQSIPNENQIANGTIFDFSNNKLTDIRELKKAVNAQILILQCNRIKDTSPISQLSELTVLNLADNRVTTLVKLRDLVKLQVLNLSKNELKKTVGIENLTMLTTLYLNENQISNISELKYLTSLQVLYLQDNMITDITDLKGLNNLIILDLSRNPLSQEQILELQESLPNCNIIH